MASPTTVIISTSNETTRVVLSNQIVTQILAPTPPVVLELGTQGPIGPQGVQGQQGIQGLQGERGQDGDGATDPGDLTLLFENKLL